MFKHIFFFIFINKRYTALKEMNFITLLFKFKKSNLKIKWKINYVSKNNSKQLNLLCYYTQYRYNYFGKESSWNVSICFFMLCWNLYILYDLLTDISKPNQMNWHGNTYQLFHLITWYLLYGEFILAVRTQKYTKGFT